jgi:hypothetical protein
MPEGSRVRQALGQAPNELEGLGVGGEALGGAPAGVHDGGVVAPAEAPANGGERLGGVLAREVHGDLAGPGEACGAVRGDVRSWITSIDGRTVSRAAPGG